MDETMDYPSTTHQSTTTTNMAYPPLGFYPSYMKTIPGILKAVQIVFSLVVFICNDVAQTGPPSAWLGFVSMTALLTTLTLLLFHLTNLFYRLWGPWILIEFIYYIIICLLYFVAAIVAAVFAPNNPAMGAAAFFAFAVLVVYGIDTYFKFKKWRETPDGLLTAETTTTTTTTVVTQRTEY